MSRAGRQGNWRGFVARERQKLHGSVWVELRRIDGDVMAVVQGRGRHYIGGRTWSGQGCLSVKTKTKRGRGSCVQEEEWVGTGE